MTNVLFSSDLLALLRRSALLGAVILVAFSAAACGDDDDGPTGPSAACLEEVEEVLDELNIDEDEVQALALGDSKSGSISDSDIDIEGNPIDLFVLEVEELAQLVEIHANPETGFDISLGVFDASGGIIVFSDDAEDIDATESVIADFEEGCFLVVVASRGEEGEEEGSYTIEVED